MSGTTKTPNRSVRRRRAYNDEWTHTVMYGDGTLDVARGGVWVPNEYLLDTRFELRQRVLRYTPDISPSQRIIGIVHMRCK